MPESPKIVKVLNVQFEPNFIWQVSSCFKQKTFLIFRARIVKGLENKLSKTFLKKAFDSVIRFRNQLSFSSLFSTNPALAGAHLKSSQVTFGRDCLAYNLLKCVA